MAVRLIIEDLEGSTTVVNLGTEEVTIGRKPHNTIQLTEQNVSRRLLIMEKEGIVKRGRRGISISEKGVGELSDLRSALENAFGPGLSIDGRIANGLGEGKFYLSLPGYRKQIIESLGFEPYPGTLNVKLDGEGIDKRRRLLQLEPILIRGFEEEGRKYGDLFAYKAKTGSMPCAIIMPLRTHHGSDTIEIISGENLRRALKKKDGQGITIEVL